RAEANPAAQGVGPALPVVALGGFRGLVADALWIRAGRLQERRRFVELVQLADWITALEPENEDVWIFHAWNLAYNVSFLLQRPEDKWRWVQDGISLLRDRGIPANPGSAPLRRELGWIYEHKIGMDTDSASPYYRAQFSREIAAYLGPAGRAPEEGSQEEAEIEAAFGLSAAKMRELEGRYGQIDWRMPLAQSLYWGSEALERADENEDLPCRRMIYVSLCSMARANGILISDPEDPDAPWAAGPNVGLVDTAAEFLRETVERHGVAGVRHAYAGFLFDAVALKLGTGHEAEARAYHARLKEFLLACGVRNPPEWNELGPGTGLRILDALEAAGW
ncbi:MAG: hypothetical protein IJ783_03195, partial [Kiritimatiellae bacterium]|nr:hypothetical protein [Kiritimatiellia bacterium]